MIVRYGRPYFMTARESCEAFDLAWDEMVQGLQRVCEDIATRRLTNQRVVCERFLAADHATPKGD